MDTRTGIIVVGKVAPKILSENGASLLDCFGKDDDSIVDGYIQSSVFHDDFTSFFDKQTSTFYDVCVLVLLAKVPDWLVTAGKSGNELLRYWEIEFLKNLNKLILSDLRYVGLTPRTFYHMLVYDETVIRTSARFNGISKADACRYMEAVERANEPVQRLPIFHLVFPGF